MLHAFFHPLATLGSVILALAPEANFAELFFYQLSAIGVVLVSLAALWLLCEGLGRVFLVISPQAKARLSPPVAQTSLEVEPQLCVGIEPEIAAVIAAAVTAVMGPGYTVAKIRPAIRAPAQAVQLAAWTMQGRLQHHTSHAVR